jgi:hypothetical protein
MLRHSSSRQRVRRQHGPPSRTAPGHAIDIGHQAVGWSEHEAALLQVADDLYENSVVSRRRLPRCQGNARPGSSWTPVFTAGQYNLGILGPKFLWRAARRLPARLRALGRPHRKSTMANLEVADETAERVLGHSLGGLMATYNVSRHRKQKMAALVALEADLLRITNNPSACNVIKLRA